MERAGGTSVDPYSLLRHTGTVPELKTAQARPELPPNQIVVEVPFWWWCFWRPHVFAWRRANASWLQQVCERCGSTGESRQVDDR